VPCRQTRHQRRAGPPFRGPARARAPWVRSRGR
jgi:hypothetical protein